MADPTGPERARMACRIHLKLHASGPAGAPVTRDDALGPDGDPEANLPAAVEAVARRIDDTILDKPGHAGGVPHHALTAAMRGRMDEGDTLGRLRAAVAGGAGLGNPVRLEAVVRTGRLDAPGP